MTLIGLLVTLILIGLMFWAVRTLAPVLKVPEPIVTVIYVLMVVLVVLWLVSQFGLISGGPVIRFG